jgi:transposase
MPLNRLTPTHSNGVTSKDVPPTEVTPRAKRRTFSATYKLRILEEADACTEPGEIGAILRREGLYSSNLTTWRRQREAGQLQGLAPKKRGRKQAEEAALRDQLDQLRREKQQLEARLEKAETMGIS